MSRRLKNRILIFLLAGTLWMPDFSSAARADEPAEQRPVITAAPITAQTLGGRQFWGDMYFLQGWRIQRNVLLGQYRLLDPTDRRHVSGTLQECRQQLDRIRDEQQLAPMSGKVVLLIHGLIRSSKSFAGLQAVLSEQGYSVVGFDYPSTRVSIQDSASFLNSVIESLGDQVTSIDVVAHSMGGIVLRSYLQSYSEPRLNRAVMLGVPNRGADIAQRLKSLRLFRLIYGPAGQQLASGTDSFVEQLPVPEFEFGIVAGGRGSLKGFNPLLPGDNDSTVTVSSTRLPGAADFLMVPVLHVFLMSNDEVIQATSCFLKHGRFSLERPPRPITAQDLDLPEPDAAPETDSESAESDHNTPPAADSPADPNNPSAPSESSSPSNSCRSIPDDL